MTDSTLKKLFESSRLPASRFTHENHVRLAWVYLRKDGFQTAADAYCRDLKRYAASLNVPDKYHETISRFFLEAINARMLTSSARDWDTFRSENPDLVESASSLLRRHYSKDILRSDLARTTWVPPDLEPMPG